MSAPLTLRLRRLRLLMLMLLAGLVALLLPGLLPVLAAPAVPTSVMPLTSAAQTTLGTWSAMGAIAGQRAEATSAPSVVSWGPGRLDLFVRGRSGELYQNYRDQGGWTGWRVPAGFGGVSLSSAPSCATWGVGKISCVALIDGDRQVWHFYYDGQAWAREGLGGEAISAPIIVAPRPNQLAIFVAGNGGHLFGKGWVPERWSPWYDLGGELRAAPACAPWTVGTINCFVTNTQGSLSRQEIVIQNEVLIGRGYVPLGMTEQGGNLVTIGSTPSAATVGAGRIALFVLNHGQSLFLATWTGQDGLIWQRANENLALSGTPSCVVIAASQAACFARGSDSPLLNAFGDLLQTTASVQ